ncbi:hypothetical protein MIR68_007998 [Amoeboaphelidium protococcarum]|nr:hypothetical protein MIR68_007998 [Amoeboaphelidium protococcarum]
MQSDDVIWGVINDYFCSFKVSTRTKEKFCKNEYNATGLCDRKSCPLANSRYATVKEDKGVLYLYVKTVERAHMPAKMWEKIQLSKNYTQALQQIDEELIHWPEFMIHRCKQRLTRLTQYLIKMRRLSVRGNSRLVPIKRKTERRDERREMKAEVAAKLDQNIQKELLERLKNGTYGELYKDILNVDKDQFSAAMEQIEKEQQQQQLESGEEEEYEYEEDMDEDEYELEHLDQERELVDMSEGDEDYDFEDYDGVDFNASYYSSQDEDESGEDEVEEEEEVLDSNQVQVGQSAKSPKQSKPSKRRRGQYVEIEYEHEHEAPAKLLN